MAGFGIRDIDTKTIIRICREHDVSKIGVFGSLARGEASEASDIDLLIEFSKRKSLLAMIADRKSVV